MGGWGAEKWLMMAVAHVMLTVRLKEVLQHQNAGQWGGREFR